jgi:hypothetical protein
LDAEDASDQDVEQAETRQNIPKAHRALCLRLVFFISNVELESS